MYRLPSEDTTPWSAPRALYGVLDAMPGNIALLDAKGVIVAVNAAWRRYACGNGMASPGFGVGHDYPALCDAVGDAEASAAARAIRTVLAGQSPEESIDYPCHSPGALRWFRLAVAPLSAPLAGSSAGGAVVMHTDITELMLTRNQAQRLNDQLAAAQAVAKVGSWSLDLTTGAVEWSAEAHRIFGSDPARQAPSFEAYLGCLHPEDRAATRAMFERSFAEGSGGAHEQRVLLSDGTTRIIEERWQLSCDEHGKPLHAVGTCQDITQRKQDERRMRDMAAHLSHTIESITDSFYTVDRAWRITHVNDKLLALLRKARHAVVGQVLWEVSPHLLGTPFERDYRIAMRDGVAVTTDAWLPMRQCWFRSHAYPSEAGLTVQFRDVGEEHATRRHLELLEASVAQLQDMVLIVDTAPQASERRITFVNDSVLRNTGYSREELLGQTASMLHGPATNAAELERVRALMDRREPAHMEIVHYRKSGEPFWTEVDIVPIRLESQPSGPFVCVWRDITDRRRDRDALRELNAELEARVLARTADLQLAREEAERANRAKSVFLATMSHEIRTPMNGVMGMIDVLHQTRLDQHQVEMVDLIRDSADTLLAIVDDILDFSKIEAGKLQIEHAPMQLADAVEKVCGLLGQSAVKRGVRMAVFVDPAIPRLLAGDETRVRQVLLNLCSNAIKFSSGAGQGGEMSVRATLRAEDVDGVEVELAVADNGIGMDAATLERLFTPFSQADGSTTRRFGGTGLGLAITSLLVRLMGGEIDVRSAPAAGSTFSVRLRFARVDAARIGPPAALLTAPGAASPQALDHAGAARGRLILVAEDNETNRLVIEQQLALLGHAADVVVNGRAALARWRSGNYALLLTDLHMPEMDGYALAAAVRAEERDHPGRPRTPILALTANAMNGEAQRCHAAGMDAYLTKPIRLAPLRDALDRWLADPHASAPVPSPAHAHAHPAMPAISARDAAAGSQVVDLSALRALVGDDPVVLGEVLQAFRVSAAQLIADMLRAGTGDTQQALAAAHKMKSGAAAIGAARLADVCAAIEHAGKDCASPALQLRLQAELSAVLDSLDRSEASP